MSKLSVIIPVYNGEKFLRNCLDSVLNQSLNDIDVIIVNDGSNDSSEIISKEYAKKDARVRYFFKENGGVSSARNMGLDHATSEYIVFVDCDDVISREYCSILYAEIEKYKAGFAFCEIKRFNTVEGFVDDAMFDESSCCGMQLEQPTIYKSAIAARIAFGKVTELGENLNFPFCVCVYKKSILDKYNIRFSENLRLGEDWIFLMKYLLHCKTAIRIKNVLYGYRQNDTSVMNTYKNWYLDNLQSYSKELILICNELEQSIACGIVKDCRSVNLAVLIINALDNYRGKRDYLTRTIKEAIKNRDCFKRYYKYANNNKERLLCLLIVMKQKAVLSAIYR